MRNKNLTLNLKAVWYIMIESGVKTEEYREIKEYWIKRLEGRDYETVTFVYGYTSRKMKFKIESVTKNTGNPEWGAEPGVTYYVIKLGERIE